MPISQETLGALLSRDLNYRVNNNDFFSGDRAYRLRAPFLSGHFASAWEFVWFQYYGSTTSLLLY